MYLGKAKEIGWCRECKQPIYDYEQNVLKMYKKVRGLREAVNLSCFSDEIHELPSMEKFIYL